MISEKWQKKNFKRFFSFFFYHLLFTRLTEAHCEKLASGLLEVIGWAKNGPARPLYSVDSVPSIQSPGPACFTITFWGRDKLDSDIILFFLFFLFFASRLASLSFSVYVPFRPAMSSSSRDYGWPIFRLLLFNHVHYEIFLSLESSTFAQMAFRFSSK